MQNYRDKKILVTGASGFIGSRLTERLAIEEKANVTALVNTWAKSTWISRLNIELKKCDINSKSDIEEVIKGNDVVFHCVGLGGSYENCMKINLEGTKNVLEACQKNNIKRVVFISSVVVHGPEVLEGMNESAPYKKIGNSYADSKIEAEKYLLDFTKKHGIEGVIIRPTYVWGPVSPYYTIDIINQMKAGSFLLVDRGKGGCNAVYIDNLVDLIILAGYHPKASGEIFLATDGEQITWKQFWSYFAKMLDKDINDFVSVPSKNSLIRTVKIKIKKILVNTRNFLTIIIDKINPSYPLFTKYFLKSVRKLVKMNLKYISKITPEMDEWNLKKYSSMGYISIEKSKKTLGYSPIYKISEAMEDTQKWLKMQNIIP